MQSAGTKSLLDAKLSEFTAYVQLNQPKAAEAVRADVHSLLDAYMDQQSEAFTKLRDSLT